MALSRAEKLRLLQEAEAAAAAPATGGLTREQKIALLQGPAPAAAPAEAPVANAGNTRPEVGTVGRIAFPALAEYVEREGAAPSVGKYGALAKDVVSAPRRIFGAGVELAKGNPAGARQEMEATGGKGVINTLAREAPLMFTPGGVVRGAQGVGRIGSAVVAGVKEALPSAVFHQAERESTGEGASAGSFMGELLTGGGLRGAFQGAGELIKGGITRIKTGLSRDTEVAKEALDAATDPVGGAAALERFKAAGKMYGTDAGTDVTPIAEDLGARVEAENAQRVAATEAARRAQAEGFEKGLVELRGEVTGRKVGRITDLSADDAGTNVKFALETAKAPLQHTYREGDRAAYGGLRTAPAMTKDVSRIELSDTPTLFRDEEGNLIEEATPAAREVVDKVPVLPGRIEAIMTEFKALSPDQGVAKVSPAGQKALGWARDLAHRANTVDDLVDLKAQVRGMQATGGFEGALFDATRDDLAIAKVLEAVHEVEAESIRAAAPKRAAKVIAMVQANNELYGRSLEALRKGDLRFRATQNSESIIGKIKAMGPEEARALQAEAQTNKVLAPYVKQLQNGFLDDLLLSSVKDGQFSPQAMAKTWSNLSTDLKEAWLTPQLIQRIDQAVAKGTAEIADPELVGKNLFGKNMVKLDRDRVIDAGKKLSNIDTEAQKKALAELQALDELFGTDFTQEAVSAFRAKQLQITPQGEVPSVGGIRTGKADKFSGRGAAVGATIGAGIGGMGGGVLAGAGAGVGLLVGGKIGTFLQSPAGALLMFQALNRLERPGAGRALARKATSQTVRSAAFGGKDDE